MSQPMEPREHSENQCTVTPEYDTAAVNELEKQKLDPSPKARDCMPVPCCDVSA